MVRSYMTCDPLQILLEIATRKAIEVPINIEASSFNHTYSGKAISIPYSECVFVALGI
jgi:hypothetical protein